MPAGLFGSFVAAVLREMGSSAADYLPVYDSFAVISVVGTIQNTSGDELGLNQPSYHHNATLNYVENLQYDRSNKGIFLYFDTGGGGVYESDELYRALMEYKEATGRPIYAFSAPRLPAAATISPWRRTTSPPTATPPPAPSASS